MVTVALKLDLYDKLAFFTVWTLLVGPSDLYKPSMLNMTCNPANATHSFAQSLLEVIKRNSTLVQI